MTKKPNRYEQYAKLSEAKVKGKGKNNIENIVPLCAYLSGSTISLEIVPKYEHGSPRTPISLQAFCKFPNLCNALSKALLKHHKNSTYRTIESMVGNLKAGFLTYLEEIDKTDISVSEIDQALLNSFKAWLNQASTGDFNEAKWAVNTRMKRHGAIWLVIKQLEKIPEGIDLQELRRPKNQWPSAHKKSKPVEGFSQENLDLNQ